MISLIDEKNKYELIKKVVPNFLYNRFDVLFDKNFELCEITTHDKTIYVPLHLDGDTCYIGVYLVEMPQIVFNELIDFVYKNFKSIDYIKIRHSFNNYKGLKSGEHWTIQLPQTEEEYLESLGTKTRQHIKRYFRLLENNYKCEFKTFDRTDISDEIVKTYFRFKKETIGHIYKNTVNQYLNEYKITKAYVLYLDNQIAAISFISEVESGDVYYENFSYDKKYTKNSLGLVITYFTIKNLIHNKIKNFYLAGGNYLYKRQISNKHDYTYTGTIYKITSFASLGRALFSARQNQEFTIFRIFGIKIKKRRKEKPLPIKIQQNTRCLLVAPHPDDDMLGCGAFVIKYSGNFDCICMGSSGVAHSDGTLGAKKRSKIRINEFYNVMDKLGIKNRWIYETYGIPRMDKQMDAHFDEYCKVLDTTKYDYIFLPHPKDGHHEHRYITNKLFKKILKKNGINENCKIVFYEVWRNMKNPNTEFDMKGPGNIHAKGTTCYCNLPQPANSLLPEIKTESLYNLKCEMIKMYKSQWRIANIYDIPTMKKYLQSDFVENYHVINIRKYLNNF